MLVTDLYKYSPDAVPPIHAADKPPPAAQNDDKFRSILATIYNQSQLAERKHVARHWSINTAATAVPLSAHPSPLVITTKLAATILGGPLFGGGVLPVQYCPCGAGCSQIFRPLWQYELSNNKQPVWAVTLTWQERYMSIFHDDLQTQ